MNRKRFVPALLTIGLCSSTVLTAQSTVPRYPQNGSPLVEHNPKVNALRAIVAMNQSRITALGYLYNHPLSVSPNPLRGQELGTIPPVTSETAAQVERRPECPMPVARSIVKNDSMPVRRLPAQNVEPMPVSPSLCVNPLSAKP